VIVTAQPGITKIWFAVLKFARPSTNPKRGGKRHNVASAIYKKTDCLIVWHCRTRWDNSTRNHNRSASSRLTSAVSVIIENEVGLRLPGKALYGEAPQKLQQMHSPPFYGWTVCEISVGYGFVVCSRWSAPDGVIILSSRSSCIYAKRHTSPTSETFILFCHPLNAILRPFYVSISTPSDWWKALYQISHNRPITVPGS